MMRSRQPEGTVRLPHPQKLPVHTQRVRIRASPSRMGAGMRGTTDAEAFGGRDDRGTGASTMVPRQPEVAPDENRTP